MNSMNSSIHPTAIGAARGAHAMLTETLERLKQERDRLARLERKDEELAEQIRKSRKGLDVLNEKQVSEHSGKERQRELLRIEMQDAPLRIDSLLRKLAGDLRHASTVVNAALHPGLGFVLQKGIEAVLPWCQSRGEAEQLIRNTMGVKAYDGLCRPQWGYGEFGSEGEGTGAVQMLTEIIAGRNPIKAVGIDLTAES